VRALVIRPNAVNVRCQRWLAVWRVGESVCLSLQARGTQMVRCTDKAESCWTQVSFGYKGQAVKGRHMYVSRYVSKRT
jgi:hypothetical protein